jgi:riboflavin-specific deaminase-like protein
MSARTPRPFVLVNMAMTADAKIATADRSITTFGSARDLAHLYALRATADALLCGARTIEETGATLGNGPDPTGRVRKLRVKNGLPEYPLRVVVSGSASLSSKAGLWKTKTAPIIVLTSSRAPAAARKRLATLADAVWTSRGKSVDLKGALERLHSERGVRRLLCEGGGQLNGALFAADLVDEIHLTVCPLLFGGRSAPSIFDGDGFAQLSKATRWQQTSSRRVGDELFLVFRRNRAS